MMDREDWLRVEHFTEKENWGDASKMDKTLLWALDHLRKIAGAPIVIHCGYAEGGHTNGSYHYKGMAADLHIGRISLVDQFLIASSIPEFMGIGTYPFWNNPGLHLDVRPTAQRATWGQNASGMYVSLDGKFLRSFT